MTGLRGNEPDLDAIRRRAEWVRKWWKKNKMLGGAATPNVLEVRNLCDDVDQLVRAYAELQRDFSGEQADANVYIEQAKAAEARVAQLETALAAARPHIKHTFLWVDVPGQPALMHTVDAPDCPACALDAALVSAGQGDTP